MSKIISSEKKSHIELQKQLQDCSKAMGGINYFLQLLEAIRDAHPNPIINKNCEFRYPLGSIKWSKPIFKDKLTLLYQIRKSTQDGNLFPNKGNKGFKSVLNLLRTLHPISFQIQPKNQKDGEGFSVHPFDIIDQNTTTINPLFDAIFFMPVHLVKKMLKSK